MDKPAQQPAGYLSAIYPGPVPLALSKIGIGKTAREADYGSAIPALTLKPATTSRSRVCEQVWLDGELFGQPEDQPIYATTEDDYRHLTATGIFHKEGGTAALFGRLGEQLILRDIQSDKFKAGKRFQVADAILECTGTSTCTIISKTYDASKPFNPTPPLTATISIYIFQINEPGLIEPGCPFFQT